MKTELMRQQENAIKAVMEAEEMRLSRELVANAKLARRDFAWVLHPEETLLTFLRAYLE